LLIPVLFLMILIAGFQVPLLVRKGEYRELFGFGLLWSVVTVFVALVASERYSLPGLVYLIEALYDYIELFR